jgi:hypothetical protein
MTGSNLVLIVVPIVMLAALGVWLGLVYYVGAHPEWKAHRLAREAGARQAAEPAGRKQMAVASGGQRAGAVGEEQARVTPHAA